MVPERMPQRARYDSVIFIPCICRVRWVTLVEEKDHSHRWMTVDQLCYKLELTMAVELMKQIFPLLHGYDGNILL